jgi:hypothetical protein
MLEEAQRKSVRAKLPISDEQLLAIAATAILGSNHFPRPTDEWEAKPIADKTWTNWKRHYRQAHIARKRQMLAAGSPTFGTANAVTAEPTITPDTFAQLDGYLNNLAAAATNEKSTLAQLVENNASLTASVAALTASVTSLTAAYTLLSNAKPPAATNAPTNPAQKRTKAKLDPNGYCWTHGYMVRVGHTSATCTDKKLGHQDAATRANTMGGTERGKPPT